MLRFAPSLTSDINIDDLRIALFNYIVSKQRDEGLAVRIENIDKDNNIDVDDKEILELLSLFGIEYSQLIYQSESIRFHSAMALQLIHDKKAFSCFCSSDWLEKKHAEAKKEKQVYKYDDACRNLSDELVIDNTNPFTIRIKGDDSFVIMNQDKTPTTCFASAIDDMLSDISLVIRADKHLGDAPKQEHIRNSLGYEKKIKYIHIPSVLAKNSKNISLKWLLKEGYLPSAISNYLISIGNKTPTKIFNISDAIEFLNINNISNSPALFDIESLKHINKEHLKNLDDVELSRYVGFADANIGKLAKFYLKEVSTTKELKSKIKPIFTTKEIPQEFMEISKTLTKVIENAPFCEEYDEFKRYIVKETDLKDEAIEKPLTYLLTGTQNTRDIAKIYRYIKHYIGEITR